MADEHDIGGESDRLPRGPAPARPRQTTPVDAATPPDDVAERRRQIEDYRKRIDQIDEQLMKLFNARSACAVEIGRLKRLVGLPVYQPDREKWILERVARNNPGPLDSGAVRRVFERVIDESRRLERLAGEEQARAGEPASKREGD
jgi:chorismate mutase